MTGQTTAFCDHVYAWDQNNARGPSIRPEKKRFFSIRPGLYYGRLWYMHQLENCRLPRGSDTKLMFVFLVLAWVQSYIYLIKHVPNLFMTKNEGDTLWKRMGTATMFICCVSPIALETYYQLYVLWHNWIQLSLQYNFHVSLLSNAGRRIFSKQNC